MSVEDIFSGIGSEGTAVDLEARTADKEEVKLPSESLTEKETKVKEPSQKGEQQDNTSEEKLPFHKHPRWIKQQKENETLRQEIEKLKSLETRFNEIEPNLKKEVPTAPQWWVDRYGNDEKSLQNYQEYAETTKQERDRIKQEVVSELQREQEAKSQEATKANEYVESQIAEMQDEGIEFDRNELMKFMVDYQDEFGASGLLDDKGNYDFRKSLNLMQRMSPKAEDTTSDTRKKIAGDAMKTKVKATQSTSIPVVSRSSLRGNWRDAIK